jgi:hypothetical protein
LPLPPLLPIEPLLRSHGRACPGPSASFSLKARKKDVDARDNPRIKSGDGYDGESSGPGTKKTDARFQFRSEIGLWSAFGLRPFRAKAIFNSIATAPLKLRSIRAGIGDSYQQPASAALLSGVIGSKAMFARQ